MRMLILSYMIQQVIHNVCTKFQNPRCSSSCEIFNQKNIGEKEKKDNASRKHAYIILTPLNPPFI